MGKRRPKNDPLVQLIIVFRDGAHINTGVMYRSEASGHIRNWWSAKNIGAGTIEAVAGSPEAIRNAQEKSAEWVAGSTLAITHVNDDGDTFMSCAWEVAGVVGMYTVPYTPDASHRIADAIERAEQERRRGEEWRDGPEGSDED